MSEITNILNQAIKESQAWSVVIMRPNQELGVLECIASVGIPKDWEYITNKLDSSTGNGRSYLSGKPVLIENVFIEQPDGGETYHYMSAIVVVPIKRDAEVIATLEVIKDKKDSRFTSKEIKKLENLALRLAPLDIM